MSLFTIFSPKWLVENVFTLYGGSGKGDSPDAPDYSEIAASNKYAAQKAYQAAQDDLDFRRQVYDENQPRQDQLYDIASEVAAQQLSSSYDNQQQARQQWDSYNSTYRPIELQTVLDSMGSQYLSEEDVNELTEYLTNPQYDTEDIMRTRQVPYYEEVPWEETTTSTENISSSSPSQPYVAGLPYRFGNGTKYGRSAAPVPTEKTTKTTKSGVKQERKYRTEEYLASQDKKLNKDYEKQRAIAIDRLAKKAQEGAAKRAQEGVAAQTNSAFAQQARNLARMGINPARMQAIAADSAQQQALTGVNAANQARTNQAAQQVGLRTGVANFGRNMPNTAGQAYATSGGLGSQAVGNQNTGANAGLAQAQFAAGGYGSVQNAAALQQRGALGLGQLQNQSYGAQLNAAAQGDSMLGGLLGAGLQAGAIYYGGR